MIMIPLIHVRSRLFEVASQRECYYVVHNLYDFYAENRLVISISIFYSSFFPFFMSEPTAKK